MVLYSFCLLTIIQYHFWTWAFKRVDCCIDRKIENEQWTNTFLCRMALLVLRSFHLVPSNLALRDHRILDFICFVVWEQNDVSQFINTSLFVSEQFVNQQFLQKYGSIPSTQNSSIFAFAELINNYKWVW